MLISVIIPCHNAGRWIGETLKSVAAQTQPAHEIIVIDDASTDDSIEQVHRSGVPVKLHHVEVRNAAAARNVGIRAATGDWIAFLDADDVWYPNHLARAAELLGVSHDIAFMSNHDWISVHGGVIPMPEASQCRLPGPACGLDMEDFFDLQETGFHFGHLTVLYLRERALEAGLFDESQVRRHDIDLWLRMIAGHAWTYDTVKSAGYREDTPESLSKNALECDYYYLRALIKNLPDTPSTLMKKHITRQARRAIGVAFVDAPAGKLQRIKGLAWPHLPWQFRLYYTVASFCPEVFQSAMRLRRRLTMPHAA